jgi:transforming growth factor-beta-induced protein
MLRRKMSIVLVALAVLASITIPAFAQDAAQRMSGQASEAAVISTLQSRPELSQFTNALKASDLDTVLRSGGQYTIFAPTNDAFSRMPADKASTMNQNKQGIDYVLGYHIVGGKLTPQQLKYTDSLTTLSTMDVRVSMGGNDIFVDGARIIGDGIDTGNVMIYPINAVMIPPRM